MILTHSVKVCLATQPCDLRKSFNTLSCVVEEQLKEDPLSSKLFVFLNKRADRVKMLYWDGSGLWVLAKRLEKGTFSWPESANGSRDKISLTPQALAMLTDGIELKDGMTRAWYEESPKR